MPAFEPKVSSTCDVVRMMIIPTTCRDLSSRNNFSDNSFATHVNAGGRRRPTTLVTHHWNNLFSHTIAAIVADALDRPTYCSVLDQLETPERVDLLRRRLQELGAGENVYWFCPVSVDQHCTICGFAHGKDTASGLDYNVCTCPMEKHETGDLCEVNKFHHVLTRMVHDDPSFRHLVAIDERFEIYTRAWCIAEIAQAAELGIPQVFKMFSLTALFQRRTHLMALDVRNCQTSRDTDKQLILSWIPDISLFNARIRKILLEEDDSVLRKIASHEFEQHQLDRLRKSWQKVEAFGIEHVGVLLFKRIFELAPWTLQLFSFRDELDLYSSPKLVAHGVRVVSTVGNVVAGIDHMECLTPKLQYIVRQHHIGKPIDNNTFNDFGQALLDTLRVVLEADFDEHVQEVWLAIFCRVKLIMLGALGEHERRYSV
eukprot:TRINITY_DN71969_c0_g1_i1.p1 TRINITY_DN71969_c0_g1~~TRINITY_DN71969_c0_g1_i1.p1  ORF type:complete len:471 (-),score=40.87 TRINITY_DN71969_c0_g1_i1:417-1700(-)